MTTTLCQRSQVSSIDDLSSWRRWGLVPFFITLVSAFSCASARDIERPTEGVASAPVTIVEFADYQCRSCAQLGRRLKTLVQEEPSKLRLEYRHCPSRRHPVGQEAAVVAAAAHFDGDFWQLHWRLVEEGPLRTSEALWSIVRESGLDEDRIRSRIESGRPQLIVDQDLALADRLAVRGVPTVFINSHRVEGSVSLDVLRSEVERAAAVLAE